MVVIVVFLLLFETLITTLPFCTPFSTHSLFFLPTSLLTLTQKFYKVTEVEFMKITM